MATTKKTPAKKTAKPAAKPPKAAAVVVRPPSAAETVSLVFDAMLLDYAAGFSLEACLDLHAPGVRTFSARSAIHANPELRKRWLAIKEHRATHMIERAGDVALAMSGTALQREGGAKLLISLAEKIDPKNWGSKSTVALTGADGGEIKQTVTMTPSDAYRKMIGKA